MVISSNYMPFIFREFIKIYLQLLRNRNWLRDFSSMKAFRSYKYINVWIIICHPWYDRKQCSTKFCQKVVRVHLLYLIYFQRRWRLFLEKCAIYNLNLSRDYEKNPEPSQNDEKILNDWRKMIKKWNRIC